MSDQHPCFSDIRGLGDVVRQVAATVAQGRGLMLRGAPGVGATMIARRIPGLLGPMTEAEIDAARERIAAHFRGNPPADYPYHLRPLRAPHHTCSVAALLGNDRYPGELQLAQGGVLLLDEVTEFRLSTLDALRSALRSMESAPLLVASARLCHCGYKGSKRPCGCQQLGLTGFADRMRRVAKALGDLVTIELPTVTLASLRDSERAPTTAQLREEFGF